MKTIYIVECFLIVTDPNAAYLSRNPGHCER